MIRSSDNLSSDLLLIVLLEMTQSLLAKVRVTIKDSELSHSVMATPGQNPCSLFFTLPPYWFGLLGNAIATPFCQ